MTGNTQIRADQLRVGDVLASTGDTIKNIWDDVQDSAKLYVRIAGRPKAAHWDRSTSVRVRRI